ncbi:hypothetical protein QQF64_029286 [Cirrhinus molitorella]|uniref:Uncharacterized protein n=1 Tax=Cirrhinus molitorella TaxID=172907 RepID=A0ABR3N910_9TELE
MSQMDFIKRYGVKPLLIPNEETFLEGRSGCLALQAFPRSHEPCSTLTGLFSFNLIVYKPVQLRSAGEFSFRLMIWSCFLMRVFDSRHFHSLGLWEEPLYFR